MPLTSNYPGSIDNGTSLPSPNDNSYTNAPDHAQLHAEENAILIALETKLGFGNSSPTSGTTGYLLTSNGDGSTSWTAPPVSAVWGLITGTLSNQPDLATALAGKLALAGGTMTGNLILNANPTTALGAATKEYVDNLGTATLIQNETPGGSINGSNTSFTTASVFNSGSLRVYLNGQRLTAGSGNDYVEGTQAFTMQYAPVTGDVLLVDYNVTNSHFIQGSNSIVVQEVPSGTVNGSNTSFTTQLGKYVANTLEVFINGVAQVRTTDYTETTPSSGVFTMAVAPYTNDTITVCYQFSTGASGNAQTVNGIQASATPTANELYPLNSNAAFPLSILDQTSASAWQSWTPTWTGLTVGNGTVTARYMQVGKGVFFRLQLAFGTTTTLPTSADTIFTFPVNINTTGLTSYFSQLGNGAMGIGAAAYFVSANYYSSTQGVFQGYTGSPVGLQALDTNHYTSASNWVLTVEGFYEAA